MIDVRRLVRWGRTPLVVVELSGCLTQLEHQVFVPVIQSEIRHHNSLRLAFELDDELQWEARSQWRSLQFDPHSRSQILKLAVIGGSPAWQKWICGACQPLTVRQALLFTSSQKSRALNWTRV